MLSPFTYNRRRRRSLVLATIRETGRTLWADEKAGYELFKTNCASCYIGWALGGLSIEKTGVRKQDYFKLRGSPITEVDNGCFNITKQEQDSQFFKALVLPDIELTFPCFHDGLVDSLAEAVRIMEIF